MVTPMPLPRITLVEQATKQIAQMISERKWKPGEKLPSEASLCQAFGIGRSTMREALKSLAFVGMVEIRHGEGTYVIEEPSGLLDRIFTRGSLTNEKVNDLCEARIALESELSALCAKRATDEDLRTLDNLATAMQQSIHDSGDRFLQLDLEFHLSIAKFSKNQILAHSLRTIRELLHELIMKSQELPKARGLACIHHARILEALKQHNPRKARSEMRSHLGLFQRQYKVLLKAAKWGLRAHRHFAPLSNAL